MLVGVIGYRVHPTRHQLLGAALSLGGVLTVLSRGDALALLRIQLVEGDLLMVLGIIGWAVYSWMLARPPRTCAAPSAPTGTGPSSCSHNACSAW
jgi:drug/metabolite transporter (DMT)-like permease